MQIAIMVYPGMTALDAIGPYEVLQNLPGCDLRFVWKEVGPIVTDSGVLILGATHTFDETPHPDVVLIPGSSRSSGAMMADRQVHDWLRHVHPGTRLTTSVCSGALILAAAGLLDGHPATSHWAAFPLFAQFGVEARPNERTVRSGKLWTAAGVSAGIDLALEIAAELTDRETAEVIQLLVEYDPRPPFDAGHTSKASPEVRRRAERQMRQLALSPSELGAVSTALMRRWAAVLYRKVRREAAPVR